MLDLTRVWPEPDMKIQVMPSYGTVPAEDRRDLGFLSFCWCFHRAHQSLVPTRGSAWITLGHPFPARTNILCTRRQNSAVVSPAKYTDNMLDESSNKNVNVVGTAPHRVMVRCSLNLLLHNQCMGPKPRRLFLNIQTAENS